MAFMRHNNNGRRHNNRHRHQGGQNNGQNSQRRNVNRINHVFESNGPEGRIRGTAQQIVEKYSTMARDANASGDKVLSLNYLQHAEHYQRLYNEILEESAAFEREREQNRQQQSQQPEIIEGSEQSEAQPQQQRDTRPQRQPQPQAQDADDENALPSFLQVPISSGAPAAERTERSPRQQQQRPRRAAAANAKADEPAAE